MDESMTVAQKVVKRQAPQKIPRSMILPVEDRARGFFYEHYVFGKTRAFDYIQSFPLETDTHLSASIAAVSLAYFSTRVESAEVMKLARLKYVSALQLTNEALQTGDIATKDATFLSILLLDLFEKITRRTTDSLEVRTIHVNGGIALARLRGAKQFNNSVGHDVPAPIDFVVLYQESRIYLDSMDPKARLSHTVFRFIELRVATKAGDLSGSDVVNIAKHVDADFESIYKTVPPEFQFIAVPSSNCLFEVYGYQYDIYPNRVSPTFGISSVSCEFFSTK